MTVCFLGGEGVHEALASSIASKGVGARKLIARQLEPPATVVPLKNREQPLLLGKQKPRKPVDLTRHAIVST